ncbi:MAG: hypothetical protein PVI71_12455 [Desulfobacterales bacterium]|jgi:hypothetical protein
MNQWLKFFQFFLGTVVLGATTTWVSFYIQNREVEIKELEQLGTFVEQAIDENVAVRLRFAQYFASVSKSDEVRKRWKAYEALLLEEKQKEEENLQKLKEDKEKVSELETQVAASARELADLRAKISSLSATDNADQLAELKEQLQRRENELKNEIAKRFELEQKYASIEGEIKKSQNNLIYQKSPAAQLVEKQKGRGWVYLGDYNDAEKHWVTQYFSHSPNAPPKSLSEKTLRVRAKSINVRSDKPSIFGTFAGVIDVLNTGQEVNVISVSKWQNSSYMWAEVVY